MNENEKPLRVISSLVSPTDLSALLTFKEFSFCIQPLLRRDLFTFAHACKLQFPTRPSNQLLMSACSIVCPMRNEFIFSCVFALMVPASNF